MMNVEVTAENRPACHPRQHAPARTPCETHEDQSGVQVLVVLFHKILVVLLGLLGIVLEELTPVIFLSRWYILPPVTRT